MLRVTEILTPDNFRKFSKIRYVLPNFISPPVTSLVWYGLRLADPDPKKDKISGDFRFGYPKFFHLISEKFIPNYPPTLVWMLSETSYKN